MRTKRELISTATQRFKMAVAAAITVSVAVASQGVFAQDPKYPTQTVRLILPTAPGAGLDTTTRLLADKLSKAWGQSVIVENKPGGNYMVGVNAFRNAGGDLHTLFVTDTGFVSISPSIPGPDIVEPRTTFKPITDIFHTSFVLLTRPDRFGSLEELLKVAAASPGKLNYGQSGVASVQRLSVELLKSHTGRSITFIPYRGNAAALTALVAGDVDLVSIGLPPAKPFIESGRLKPIAVTSSERIDQLPQVPTVNEAAKTKGFEAGGWVGLFGPPSIPDAIASKIQQDVATALRSADMVQFLKQNDYTGGGRSPAAFAKLADDDRAKFKKLIDDMKLTLK